MLWPNDHAVYVFPIQKQDSAKRSAGGSKTNRDVDKNSYTVNLTYTKAKERRKISNVSLSTNQEKSVLSVEEGNNNFTLKLAILTPVGVEWSLALSTSKKSYNSKQKPTKRNNTTIKDLPCNDSDSITNVLPNFTPNRTPRKSFWKLPTNTQYSHKTCWLISVILYWWSS